MPKGTILFVHGTGVRLKNYERGFEHAQKCAVAAGINEVFSPCAWGDPLGIEFEGKSLPDLPSKEQIQEEEQDFARWNWLFNDPLFELDKLTIRDTSQAGKPLPVPGSKPAWQILWEKITAYQPSIELQLLLERGGLKDFWQDAWGQIVKASPISKQAFEASSHELAEASHALARAVIAQIHVFAVADGVPGPSRALRNSIFERLLVDWNQKIFGLGDFFAKMLKRATTKVLRDHRKSFSDQAVLPIGDVLLYQSRGGEVRDFIRTKIAESTPPVTIMAHSLGGIACVDLLALPNPPRVARLVTAGSQSPLLYEIGALFSVKPPNKLPEHFPPWLNLYDRNDFLSYVASRVFPKVVDHEVESGQPFPDSHSAYFGNPAVWESIHRFMKK